MRGFASGAVLLLLASVTAFADESASPPWLESLRVNLPERAQLVAAVRPLLRNAHPAVEPDLVLITYRLSPAGIKDPVVQLYDAPPEDRAAILNPHGQLRQHVGDYMADEADKLLNLFLQQPECFGGAAEVRRQRRALSLTFSGDPSLLREQTVESLHVVGILTHADRYLPRSLRSRVRAVILTAQLDFGEWQARLNFITDNPTDAEQVGDIIAAWRDLASSLAAQYSGHVVGERLHQALQESTVVVTKNQVTATGSAPALVMVRAAKAAAGHDDGCPPGGVCDPDKIAICHTNRDHSAVTLCVPPAAVAAHLAQGDTCGPCSGRAPAGITP